MEIEGLKFDDVLVLILVRQILKNVRVQVVGVGIHQGHERAASCRRQVRNSAPGCVHAGVGVSFEERRHQLGAGVSADEDQADEEASMQVGPQERERRRVP